jgi:hypothetical protein
MDVHYLLGFYCCRRTQREARSGSAAGNPLDATRDDRTD